MGKVKSIRIGNLKNKSKLVFGDLVNATKSMDTKTIEQKRQILNKFFIDADINLLIYMRQTNMI